jgi:peptidyl-prolyl cis-trans isomerase C
MEFLSEDFATAVPPTEEQISAYYDEHRENYRIPEGASFSHVFFNTDQRGEAGALQAAAQLRSRLNAAGNGGVPDGGDPFVLPLNYASRSLPEIEELFGKTAFTDAVFSAEPESWSEPARSAYGFHIIYVRSRTASRLPVLDEVRDPVRRDLVSQRRRDANEAFYGALLEKYTVIVETDSDA